MTVHTSPEDIAKELLKLSSQDSLSAALASLGLATDASAEIVVERPWHRSGAETYLTVFTIHSEGNARPIVLKACVPSSPTVPIDEVLSQWIEKRSTIESTATTLVTPTLYAYGAGVILEEFVPFTLGEAVANSDEAALAGAELILQLAALGYDTRLAYTDFRSRGTDAVIVDFGADLGSVVRSPSLPRQEYADFLRRRRASEAAVEKVRERLG